MYEIQTDQTTPVNIIAGDYPILTEVGKVKALTDIHKLAPVIQTADGITEATTDGIDALIGIAADKSSGDEVVYYMTGEFFAAALTLPTDITIDVLKPALRKLGIFLR